MSLNIDTTATPIEAEIEAADAARIGADADAATAAGDKARILKVRGDAELNQIGGDLPDDADALWRFAEHSLVQMVVSTIDAGRALLKLKQNLSHGEFIAGLKARSIPERSARRHMVVARRFADRSQRFLQLGRTKLYACSELLFDDEAAALDGGDEVLGMTLDDLERKTAAELRAMVKKREEEIAIKEQLLEAKNRQIDAVAEENASLQHSCSLPWNEHIAPIKDEMGVYSNLLDEVMGKLMMMHGVILNVDLPDDSRDMARRSLVTRYAEILDRAAVLIAECQGKFDQELGGYIGAMREYTLQLPDATDPDQGGA